MDVSLLQMDFIFLCGYNLYLVLAHRKYGCCLLYKGCFGLLDLNEMAFLVASLSWDHSWNKYYLYSQKVRHNLNWD